MQESLTYEIVPAETNTPLNVTSPSLNHGEIIKRKLTGYVGFANLPNQWYRKSIKKGFNFNIMVVGESGLGKSTLISTLFNMPLYPAKVPRDPAAELPRTVAIETVTADLEENGVRLHLTVIDTPGFGDFVNNTDSWEPIIQNIDERFDSYLDLENNVNRMSIEDNRIHACLYFIEPTGHSLKALDVTVMKKLHKKVNLIPVIAKSDTLTEEEIVSFKKSIMTDIANQEIEIFEPPKYENDDEQTVKENTKLMLNVPFAVIGSTESVTSPSTGKTVRGRAYPWGIIEVENEEHNDFVKLRQLLIRSHMEELREKTVNILYENYRTEKLSALGIQQDYSVFREVNPALRHEEERAMHEAKLAKMESDMKTVFQQKVSEKEQKLKKSEAELFARHREMKEQLEKQRKELEEKKARLESGRIIEEKKPRKGFSLR